MAKTNQDDNTPLRDETESDPSSDGRWPSEILVKNIGSLLPEPRSICVTGASGFIGSRLANALALAGHHVTGMGRSAYRARLHPRVAFRTVDLLDEDAVATCIEGHDFVIHAAANSAPWGSLESMRRVNVEGADNVIKACVRMQVRRLVHVSSSAIFFEFRDRERIGDDAAWAKKMSCHYARTKAEAERRVNDAASELDIFTVRARAVFGHGDNSLLPRLVDAYETGRLRIIGDGKNRIDMTYVDNLVWALALAMVRGERGAACTVTNDEPVVLWDLVRQLLTTLYPERKIQLRKVPRRLALWAAWLSETRHRMLGRAGEPPLTRYGVGLLAATQTFDIQQAKQQLGYAPLIPMTEGLRRTIAALQAKSEEPPATHVPLKMFSTGYTKAPRHRIERGASKATVKLHATFGLVTHPVHGHVLLDTGYARRFFDATARWPFVLYRWATPVETQPEWSARELLRSLGIEPAEIHRVVVSHFHADHVCGLVDFPNAALIAHPDAIEVAVHARGLAALRQGILPSLIRPVLPRIQRLAFHDPGWGPWQRTHDLFGDGSLRLVELPGHAAGQIGALIETDEGPVLWAADGAWTTKTIREGLPLTFAFRAIAADSKAAKTTASRLRLALNCRPDMELIPTHCPDVVERYGLERDHSND